jgi:hypothetical protein
MSRSHERVESVVSKAKLLPEPTSSSIRASMRRPAAKAACSGQEGAQAGGDEIGVHEFRATRFVRQEFLGEGGLPCAVRPGDHEDFLHALGLRFVR